MYIIVFREGTLSVSECPLLLDSTLSDQSPLVPFPRHTASAKRAKAYQVAQGLHLRHI